MIEVRPIDAIATRTRADEVEAAALAAGVVEAPMPVAHHFAPGIYIREVRMPAGALIIGHRHRLEHFNVLVAGALTLIDEHTDARTDLRAPFSFTAPAGRKVAVIHEDVTWWNIIATEERDVEKLEAMMLDKSEAHAAHHAAAFASCVAAADADRADFALFLADVGMTAEFVREQSERDDDMIALADGFSWVEVRTSPIEGRGLFVTRHIAPNEPICPARIDGKRTIAGRFTNHAAAPNARIERANDGTLWLVASRALRGFVGGTVGEEVTIDYRQALQVTRSA